jgi:hypothetical protein
MVKPINLVFWDLSFRALVTDFPIFGTRSFNKVKELRQEEDRGEEEEEEEEEEKKKKKK